MRKSIIYPLGILLILPIAAYAVVWYVHPDSLLNTVQTALDSCAENDTVLVGPGTYFENINWPSTQGIDLVSELGRDTTIIDGSQSGRVIACTTGVDTSTKIAGFTIRNGYEEKGAGVFCGDNSSPAIIGNTVTANVAYTTGWYGGGGILCEHWSSPLIIDNVIVLNTAGHSGAGVYCDDNATPIIMHNVICENMANSGGAGIACTNGSEATISDNIIEMNTANIGAAGIMCDYSSPYISDNVIQYNTAGNFAGGIGCYTSSPIIMDNSITCNTAGVAAGGIDCSFYSSPTIRRNDISHNEGIAWQRGGIQISTSCSVIIDSCTITNNIGNGITIYVDCAAEVHYNDIVDNTGYGMECFSNPSPIDAEYNWWGDPSGPGGVGPGSGDEVSSGVDYRPWLKEPTGVEEGTVHEIKTEASGATIINGPLLVPEGTECRVFDITGRVVVIPNKMRPGVYFIEIDGNVARKVVKIR